MHPLIINLYVCILALIIYAYSMAIFRGTDDLSMSILIAKQIPYITCAVIMGGFFSRIMNVNRGCIDIERLILSAGAIQGLVVIMAMTTPDVRLLLIQFQGSESSEFLLSEHNYGVRGFALSAQQFFGLSAMLSIQAVLVTVWKISKNISFGIFSALQFVLFGFACFFVGRISGLVYILCLLLFIVLSKRYISNLIIISTVLLLALPFLNYIDYESKSIQWAAELFINLFSNEGFTTTSSTDLREKMLFAPKIDQLLIGDAVYSNPDGSYYMGTDSGFVRFVLFGGIPFLLIASLPYFIILLYGSILNNFEKHHRLGLIFIIFTIFLLQIKGEVLIVGTMVNVLFFMYLSYIISRSRKFLVKL